ncbi:MAG: trypsin-like peptidase domain-containing protein, partial [Planctomycetaceae bacterium]
SVVRISVVTAKGTASGSGCLIFDNRTVVTNFHVIEQATKATVQFADGETIDVLGSVALQPEKDLAVLRLKRPRPKGRPLELVKVLPNKGERVIAFGAPLGLSFSTSDGIVSAIRTPEEIARLGGFPHGYGRTATWIQMTTPISPGNSGGPLVNRKGEVVGLNSLILSFRLNKKGEKVRGQNLNFAVSFKDVREIGEKLSTRPVPLKNRGN